MNNFSWLGGAWVSSSGVANGGVANGAGLGVQVTSPPDLNQVTGIPRQEAEQTFQEILGARNALAQLAQRFDDNNESAPRKGLQMKSPRQFIRSPVHPQPPIGNRIRSGLAGATPREADHPIGTA